MTEPSRDLHLAVEAFGAEIGGEMRMEDLHGHVTAVLPILRQVDGGHASAADLSLNHIAIGQDRLRLCLRSGQTGFLQGEEFKVCFSSDLSQSVCYSRLSRA